MIDADKSGPRCSRMWWKIGTLLEKAALDSVAKEHPVQTTISLGLAAEAAYWQATGEGDMVSAKALAPPPPTGSKG